MAFSHIFLLAVIQGVTEFLPISSSGHLAMMAPLLNWQDQGLAFDVAVHFGTLIAVMLYCRGDIILMIRGLFSFIQSRQMNGGMRLFMNLVLATIPVIVIGFLFYDEISSLLRNLTIIGMATIFFGLVLGVSDYFGKTELHFRHMTKGQSLMIGLAQILALIPGTSRSGITMTMARFLGFDRQSAARFSFLLAIPTILGATTLSSIKLLSAPTIHMAQLSPSTLLMGMIIAMMTAFLAMKLLMNWLRDAGFWPFVIYRVLLGTALIAFHQLVIL